MKIGCSEVPKPTYPSLLWPAEWKAPAPLSMSNMTNQTFGKGKVVCLCYLLHLEEIGRRKRILEVMMPSATVHSVTSHLAGRIIWTGTSLFTPGRNRTNAHNVICHLFRDALWWSTYSFTVGRNRTIAHSATFHATRLVTSKRISRGTLGRNLSSATDAINLSSIRRISQAILRLTWPQIRCLFEFELHD